MKFCFTSRAAGTSSRLPQRLTAYHRRRKGHIQTAPSLSHWDNQAVISTIVDMIGHTFRLASEKEDVAFLKLEYRIRYGRCGREQD